MTTTKEMPIKKLVSLMKEVDTGTYCRIECPHCGTETCHEDVAEQAFVKNIAGDWVYATSDDYQATGWICRDCFDNEDEDWTETPY